LAYEIQYICITKKIDAKHFGQDFTRQFPAEGWNIYEKCSERAYRPDSSPQDSWVPNGTLYIPIEVLYDSTGRLNGRNILDELVKIHRTIDHAGKFVYRSDLITYIYDEGYRRPLFVDVSCAESEDLRLTTKDLRNLRAARYGLRGVAGGKRSKYRRIKRKQTRRKRRK
jgi:hypothetical protein